MTQEIARSLEQVKKARERLEKVSQNFLEELEIPEKASLYLIQKDGKHVIQNLIRGTWVETDSGLRQMFLDEDSHCGACPSASCTSSCTRVLVEAKDWVILPCHYHDYCETVTVISGEYYDLHRTEDSKLIPVVLKRCSDKIYYPKGVYHEPKLKGLFLVCWAPPLSYIQDPPLG
jgi:hypothetical protein